MSKIIFLDFDGPLIPTKAHDLPKHSNGMTRFDPCAVAMINKVCAMDTSIQLVISSNHAHNGFEHCKNLLATNNIDIGMIHKDWWTSRRTMTSDRATEIWWWLKDHPEVTHYVAVDDIPLDPKIIPNFARCDEFDGFSYRNYLELRYYLDLFHLSETKSGLAASIKYFKGREGKRILVPHQLGAVKFLNTLEEALSVNERIQNE